jgi:hypothetical protein
MTPSGRTDMTPHYAACHRAAKYIAAHIVDESDRERALRNPQVALAMLACSCPLMLYIICISYEYTLCIELFV